jgi:hypothetical protein
LLFGLFAFQLWYHAVRTSVTIDEPDHILAGYRHLQCGDFGINPEHPPLLKMLAAIPLTFRGDLVDPPWECGSKLTSTFEAFSYGNSFLVDNGVDNIVIRARLFAAVLSLVLAILVFVAAWEMFDRWAALVALTIVAFEPNLTAHGSIVTTDMAITVTAFGTVYAMYRFCKLPNLQRFAIVSLCFGLMLAAKHSAVIFVPLIFGIALIDSVVYRRTEGSLRRTLTRRIAALAVIFVIGLSILWGFYGFRYRAVPNASAQSVSAAEYIKENARRPETAESFPAIMTDHIGRAHALPESYVLGMADVIAFGTRNSWIFGVNYPAGRWFYFPVAFLVKTNFALLLLFPLGLLLPLLVREKRREAMFLLLPAVGFFAAGMSSNFNTGVRHVLPVYPLFSVAAAAGVVWFARRYQILTYALVALLVYNAAAAVRTAPNYLAFANDFWGGTDNIHKIFSDSNVDTGQSIKLVNEYIAEHDVKDCWIVDFVHRELLSYIQPCRPMPSGIVRVTSSRNVIDPIPKVIEGTVFVSVIELPPRGAGEYAPVTTAEPEALIGGNILVFRGRFEVPLASAISHVHRSGAFLRLGQIENAITEAREAVESAGDDSRPHLALGLALARARMFDDARVCFETAVSFARDKSVFRNVQIQAQQELAKLK